MKQIDSLQFIQHSKLQFAIVLCYVSNKHQRLNHCWNQTKHSNIAPPPPPSPPATGCLLSHNINIYATATRIVTVRQSERGGESYVSVLTCNPRNKTVTAAVPGYLHSAVVTVANGNVAVTLDSGAGVSWVSWSCMTRIKHFIVQQLLLMSRHTLQGHTHSTTTRSWTFVLNSTGKSVTKRR